VCTEPQINIAIHVLKFAVIKFTKVLQLARLQSPVCHQLWSGK